MDLTFPNPARVWSINEKLHWSATRQLTEAWRNAAHLAVVSHYARQGPSARRQPSPADVHLELQFATARRRDAHNYTGTVIKAIIDGMTDAGCWPDDTPHHVYVMDPRLVVVRDPRRVPSTRVVVMPSAVRVLPPSPVDTPGTL